MRFLRAYEWSKRHGASAPGIVPFVVVNLYHDDEAETQGRRAAAELAARPEGERALLPFWLLSKQIRRWIPELQGRGELDPLRIFENGIDVGPSIRWLTPLARGLRARGATLDLVASDVEDGVTVWQIADEWSAASWRRALARIYASERAVARMPEEVRRLKPADFDPWTPEGRRAAEIFNRYAQQILRDAIRRVFIESGLFLDERGRQPFRISNWECVRPTFRVEDGNGWEIAPVAVDTVSSPALYLSETGAACRATPHEPLWCRFVQALNTARSCLARGDGEVIPWVSSARFYMRPGQGEGYDGRNIWLWREMIAHLVRGGVREFLFWNSDTDPVLAHRIMSETLRRHDAPYTRAVLPRLDPDVDEVTTRGYTTRYSDFLAAVGGS